MPTLLPRRYERMIKPMQSIYRRWLSRYRWANVLRAWFLRIYFRYWTIKHIAKIPYTLVDNINQLVVMSGENISSDVLIINKATVIGYSRFILKGDMAAYDASHPGLSLNDVYAKYLFQEETHELMTFNPQINQCIFPELNPHARLGGQWLTLMNASSDNWMHWLSESIPRLAATLYCTKYGNFGLLLDRNLPKQMRQVLEILAAHIPHIEVPVHQAVEVDQLIVPAHVAGTCAFWPRNSSAPAIGIFHFDATGLGLARDVILDHFDCTPDKSRKFFILRRSFFRHIANQKRIEQILLSRGFEPISPGEMSVEEQVKAFSEAAVVVAQAGAALANIMFMPEKSTVICLSARNEHVNYDYFRDYAKIFGVSLEYVLGEIDDPSKYDETHIGKMTHPMNAEFSCPEDELLERLNELQ